MAFGTSPSLQQRSHIYPQHHPMPVVSQQHVPPTQQQQPQSSHYYNSSRSIVDNNAYNQGSNSNYPIYNKFLGPQLLQVKNRPHLQLYSLIHSSQDHIEVISGIVHDYRFTPGPHGGNIGHTVTGGFLLMITTFGCQLSKHRKSDTLEVKDILLRTDNHKERLAVIKKSISVSEAASAESIVGQAAANAKGSLLKDAYKFFWVHKISRYYEVT